MIAGVRCVVASGACAHDDRLLQRIVKSGNTGNGNGEVIEERFSSCDGLPERRIGVLPRVVEREDVGIKCRTRWIAAKRVVDADIGILLRQRNRSALGALRSKTAHMHV